MIDPQDIDPDTGLPYPGYSDPSLDDDFDYDHEEEDYSDEPKCSDPRGHRFVVSDEDENYCYCERCGVCEY